ncbi:helix-turn-helix transcriptional regulator [Paracoccus sp. (in: a-proteobacteria)]|uniref:helix-turn-helix transcriptional regulator n=1 Tax=Paracoccus sp. TaxID=267 RepID=UPI00396CBF5D
MNAPTEPPLASELIDHLYAAMFGEAPWQAFMEHSRSLLPNGQTVLFHHDKASRRGAYSLAGGLDQDMVEKYNQKYCAINPWMDHAMIRPLGRVVQADEMLPREKLLRTDFYSDYLRPQDITTGLGVTLDRNEDRHFFFSIVCADAEADRVDRAKAIISSFVPHLTRAFGSYRSAMTTEDPTSGILRIDGKLRVVSANGNALAMMQETEELTIGPLGRLVCKDVECLRIIQKVLAPDRGSTVVSPAVHYCHLKRRNGILPIRACIYRPGATGGAHVGAMDCFMRLESPVRALREAVRKFGVMHRLSAAETGIVAHLIEGLTPEQIAAERHTSSDTVRTQLKNIYRKTECGRQVDIVRHVAAMVDPKPGR